MLKSIMIINGNKKLDLMHNDFLALTSIEGVSAEGQINTSNISGYDGSTVVSTSIPMRNISILLRFFEGDAEKPKQQLYSLFPITKEIELQYISDFGTKKINGVVQKVEVSPNVYPLVAQISILCTDPFFKSIDMNIQAMSTIKPLFKFPFTFNGPFKFGERSSSVIDNFVNDSAIDVYPIIEFSAISALTNPSIMNIDTYEKMKINIEMNAGDKVIIDTRIGEKTITKVSNNMKTNIFNCMDNDFTFFKLYSGDNYIKYDADTNAEGLQIAIKWESLYGGV